LSALGANLVVSVIIHVEVNQLAGELNYVNLPYICCNIEFISHHAT